MARARNIKPSLFKNEIFGIADPLYTILFSGLWVLADRDGRLEDRPLRIKAEVFPYREGIDMDSMLHWMAVEGFIHRYRVGAARYIEIINFTKHQNPHKNEAPSEIPAFSAITEKIGTSSENIGSARADSLSLDSLNLIPDSLSAPEPSAPAAPVDCLLNDFEEVWAMYPKRPGASKADSLKAWKARIKAGATMENILSGVKRYAAYVAATGVESNFIKQPQTFFGPGEHFTSDWTIPQQARASPVQGQSQKFHFSEVNRAGDKTAMEASMRRHNIAIPDGDEEIEI